MFENQGQKDDNQESEELPTRPRLTGCNLWGTLIWILLGIAIFFLLGKSLKGGLRTPPQISYSTFRQQVKSGNVKRVTVQLLIIFHSSRSFFLQET
jgi:hypothetical protein